MGSEYTGLNARTKDPFDASVGPLGVIAPCGPLIL